MTTYLRIFQENETHAVNTDQVQSFIIIKDHDEWELRVLLNTHFVTLARTDESVSRDDLEDVLAKITTSLVAMAERGGTVTFIESTLEIREVMSRSSPQNSRY